MTPAPPPAANGPAPPTPPAWPRSAQLAAAALLLLAILLLTLQALGSRPGATRPTDLQPAAAPAYRIDLNRAGRADLLQLPGVGDHLAERIEDRRRQQGGFRSVEDLRQVPGIGPTMLERLRPWVCVRDGGPAEDSERVAEPAAAPARPKEAAAAKPAAPAKAARLTSPIDVNRATAEELQTLPGIGPKLAQRILDERARAPFHSVDDLRRVSGIGAKTLERLRPYVRVGGPPVEVAAAPE